MVVGDAAQRRLVEIGEHVAVAELVAVSSNTGIGTTPSWPAPMVYTGMPFALASSAACSGSTEPALLAPSVSRMTKPPRRWPFSIAIGLAEARDGERRAPSPIAVPSSIRPTFSRLHLAVQPVVIGGERRERVGAAAEGDDADAVARAGGR